MGWEEEKEEVVVDEVGPVELSVRTGEAHGGVVFTERNKHLREHIKHFNFNMCRTHK